MKWPGVAAVEVSIISIYKGKWFKEYNLNGKKVNAISTYLDDTIIIKEPIKLYSNKNKSFFGSKIYGSGFILEFDEKELLISNNKQNAQVIFPYLNGDDVASRYDQTPSRFVINFFDWTENYWLNSSCKCNFSYF